MVDWLALIVKDALCNIGLELDEELLRKQAALSWCQMHTVKAPAPPAVAEPPLPWAMPPAAPVAACSAAPAPPPPAATADTPAPSPPAAPAAAPAPPPPSEPAAASAAAPGRVRLVCAGSKTYSDDELQAGVVVELQEGGSLSPGANVNFAPKAKTSATERCAHTEPAEPAAAAHQPHHHAPALSPHHCSVRQV